VSSSRASKSAQAFGMAGDPRPGIARKQLLRKWGAIGVLAVTVVLAVGYFVGTRERVIPVGVAMPNLITRLMTPVEATGMLSEVRATAQVDVRNGQVTVRLTAALIPERRDGQLAFAQRYARADEIVEGRKRPISFRDTEGNEFARSVPAQGVMMTR
jgi:hypothetical protein